MDHIAGVTADVRASIVRILGTNGTAGTGFIVDRDRRLVATCAHVVDYRGVLPEHKIQVVHLDSGAQFTAQVLRKYWRGPKAEDVALLRVHGDLPPEAAAVQFAAETSPVGHRFWTFGFPSAKPEEGLVAGGQVTAELRNEQRFPVLQLGEATEIVPGFSGAPLLDLQTRRVAGMIVELTGEDHGRLAQTAFAIPAATLLAVVPDLKAPDIPPYRALGVFGEQHAAFHFGRTGTIDRIVAELGHGRRFLAVLGPSGSGKSSLVRAGVIPAVRRGDAGGNGWGIVVTRPADLRADATEGSVLSGGPIGVRRWLGENPDVTKLLLVIDQFEEVFVDPDPDHAAELVASIRAVVESTVPAAVMLTMRDEFFGQFVQRAPSLTSELKYGLEIIPPTLTRAELEEIVVEPARLVGVQFEPGLVDQIVDDAVAAARGSGDAAPNTVLPLLELTLAQVWKARSDGVMTRDRYREIGAVSGGIAGWADGALDRLGEADLPTIRVVLTGLVHLGDERLGTPDSRLRRQVDDLPGERAQVTEIVGRLAGERLVVTSRDQGRGTGFVELIHDALVREWARLRNWLDEDRRFLSWQQELDRQRLKWESDSIEGGGRDIDKLLGDRDLDTARHFEDEFSARLTGEQRAFIAESNRVRAAERKRTQRLRYSVTAVLLLLALAAAGFGVFAQFRERDAQRERYDAVASQLDTEAATVFSGVTADSDLQALAATLDARRLRSDPTASRGAFYTATAALNTTRAVISTPTPVYSVAVARDGQTLASGGTDGTDGSIRLWNFTDPAHPTSVAIPGCGPGTVFSVALGGNGRVVAAGGTDGSVRLWDATDPGHPVTRATLLNDAAKSDATKIIFGVALSSDGRTLASGGADGNVRVWDVTDPTHPKPLSQPPGGHTAAVFSVALSTDGHTLAAGSGDRTVRVWDLTNPARPPATLTGHTDAVRGVAFSPDGRILVSASGDHTVRVWDLTAPARPPAILTGHTDTVIGVAFSPDGHTLASGSDDGTVLLWDVDPTNSTHPSPLGRALIGHTDAVFGVAFSPDGRTLISGSPDRTLRLWNLDTALPLRGHRAQVFGVAFSPDRRTLASGGADGVRLWETLDSTHPELSRIRSDGAGGVFGVAFSPDGRTLATGSGDGKVRLWDVTDPGHPLATLTAHRGIVRSVAFDPERPHILASGSDDGAVRLWSVTDPKQPDRLLYGTGQVFSVAFRRTGHILASSSADDVLLWDVSDPIHPKRLGHLRGHTNTVYSVALSPNGHTLASGSADHTVRLWDVSHPAHPKQLGQPLHGHTGQVFSVAFSPDGYTLASASPDRTVRVWDVADPAHPKPLGQPLHGHTDAVDSVAFSLDGRTLASSSWDTTVRLWPTPLDADASDATAASLCAKFTSDITTRDLPDWIAHTSDSIALCPAPPHR